MSNCLQLDHVDYAYGAAKIRVLSDVSADFESGKRTSPHRAMLSSAGSKCPWCSRTIT